MCRGMRNVRPVQQLLVRTDVRGSGSARSARLPRGRMTGREDQRGRMFTACMPLGPRSVSNSTRWFSSRSRRPVPAMALK